MQNGKDILFFTKLGCQLAECGFSLHVTERNGLWTILHLRMYFFYKIDRSGKCLLIFVWCILKFKYSECDTSQITQECLKDHFFEQDIHFFTLEDKYFCALQDIRFVRMTFTGVTFKMSFIFLETILLVIMIYILRIMIFFCLTKCSLKVYMSYI